MLWGEGNTINVCKTETFTGPLYTLCKDARPSVASAWEKKKYLRAFINGTHFHLSFKAKSTLPLGIRTRNKRLINICVSDQRHLEHQSEASTKPRCRQIPLTRPQGIAQTYSPLKINPQIKTTKFPQAGGGGRGKPTRNTPTDLINSKTRPSCFHPPV
jgi:hypothetical protein